MRGHKDGGGSQTGLGSGITGLGSGMTVLGSGITGLGSEFTGLGSGITLLGSVNIKNVHNLCRYKASWPAQFSAVLKRTMIAVSRDVLLSRIKVMQAVVSIIR